MNSELTRERIAQFANDPMMCVSDEVREIARIALQSFGNSKQLDEVGSWNNHRNTPTAQAGNSPSKCSLRDGIEAIRNSCIPVDVDKIQSECEAGNSPVTPDTWIPVSERMPGSQEWGIVFAKWANQQVCAGMMCKAAGRILKTKVTTRTCSLTGCHCQQHRSRR